MKEGGRVGEDDNENEYAEIEKLQDRASRENGGGRGRRNRHI